MALKALTVGDVSPKFRDLTVEIFDNIYRSMQDFPPEFYLFVCKTMEDTLKTKLQRTTDFSKKYGLGKINVPNVVGLAESALYEYPEVIVWEDGVKSFLKNLEEYEGLYAHEAGHLRDYFKYYKLSLRGVSSILNLVINRTKEDYEAENNAIEAGYYTGCFARQFITLISQLKLPEVNDPISFMDKLSLMSVYSAFMKSDKPKIEQKQKLERTWNYFTRTRKYETTRNLLQSRELKENPGVFKDERFLKYFISKKQDGWNISLR